MINFEADFLLELERRAPKRYKRQSVVLNYVAWRSSALVHPVTVNKIALLRLNCDYGNIFIDEDSALEFGLEKDDSVYNSLNL